MERVEEKERKLTTAVRGHWGYLGRPEEDRSNLKEKKTSFVEKSKKDYWQTMKQDDPIIRDFIG